MIDFLVLFDPDPLAQITQLADFFVMLVSTRLEPELRKSDEC